MALPSMAFCDPDTRHVPASVLADALSLAGCWSTGEGTVAAWLVCRSWRDALRSPSRLAAALVAAHGPGDALDRIVYSRTLTSVDQLALVQQVLACSEPTLSQLEDALVAAAFHGATPIVQVLLQYPCTPCLSVSCQHGRALYLAARDGHDDTVKLLLEWPHGERFQQTTVAEAFVDAASTCRLGTVALLHQRAEPSTNDLYFAFMSAVHRSRFKIVRYLLSSPTNPVRADSENSEGLYVAAMQGHVGLARLLLSQPQHPARADDNMRNILEVAAGAGHWKMVRLLLSWAQHAPPADWEGSNEALQQAMYRGHVKVVKALLEHLLSTISASPAERWLEQVLIQVCRLGDTRLVRLLLTRPPNAPSADGEPSAGHEGPLVAAATAGHVHVARLLLRAGARSRIDEAFSAAVAGGHAEVAKLLLVKAQKIDAGAAIAHSVYELAAAIEGGHAEVVSWLLSLRKGCPVASFSDVFNDQWLVMAAKSGSAATVRLLLEALPQAAAVISRVGKGALRAAAKHGTAETVQLLLGRMARPAAGDGDGGGGCVGGVMWWEGEVLEVAARRGDRRVVQLLLDAWPPARPTESGASGDQGGEVEDRDFPSPSGKDRSCAPSSIPPSPPSSSPSSSSSMSPLSDSPSSPSHSAQCPDDDRRRCVQAALVAAAGAHHDEIVRQLLQWDHPNAPRADGWHSEALCVAMHNSHISTSRLLLDWPVHPALADCQEGRALADAITRHHDGVLAMLLQHPERPARGDLRDGALLVLACRKGSTKAVRMLLESPHPPRADCFTGRALVAAAERKDADKVQLLLGWPCHAPRADLNGGEVLIAAAKTRDTSLMQTLLSWPSNPPRADCRDGGALVAAVQAGSLSGVRLLLGWPCHAPRADLNGGEALIAAAKTGDTSLMQTLLSWPSNPPRADCRDGGALVAAVQAGSLEGVRLLLGWPVHPARANMRDGAALLAAGCSWHGSGAEMLQLLLSWPTCAPRADCRCGAALRSAMKRGDEASVRVLLIAGVSEEVLRELVSQCGDLELCDLLRQELQA